MGFMPATHSCLCPGFSFAPPGYSFPWLPEWRGRVFLLILVSQQQNKRLELSSPQPSCHICCLRGMRGPSLWWPPACGITSPPRCCLVPSLYAFWCTFYPHLWLRGCFLSCTVVQCGYFATWLILWLCSTILMKIVPVLILFCSCSLPWDHLVKSRL